MFDSFLNADSNIFLLLGGLVVGLVLIIFGGDWFVDSAIWMAVKTKIPQMLIGATIVSIGTTLPEVFVSFTAAVGGQTAMSVGNAIGSMFCNTALILAISMTFSPTVVKRKEFVPKIIILAISIICLFIFSMYRQINIWQSVVLVALFVIYMTYNVVSAIKEMKANKRLELLPVDVQKEELSKEHQFDAYLEKKSWLMIALFFVGAAAIAVGANLMVSTVSGICGKLNISEQIVSLTVVALGTSLPELVTALTSLKKNSTAISMGNVIGANILNGTIITGGSGLIAGGIIILEQDFASLMVTIAGVAVIMLIVCLPILFKQKTYRWQGISCLAIYGAYLAYSIASVV